MSAGRFALRLLLSLALLGIAALAALVRPDIPTDVLEARYAQPPSQFVEIDGLRVHYRDEGAGPALLLIHGSFASLHTWNAWTDELKASFRVIRFDLPGHGLTGPSPDGNYSIERDMAVALALLDHLGVSHANVAGNSLGGGVAWRLALDHPARVDQLILIDSAGLETGASSASPTLRLVGLPGISRALTLLTPRFLFRNALQEVYARDERITPELVDRYYELMRRPGNRLAALQRMRSIEPQPSERLGEIRSPTLILWGAEDRWIPLENAQRFQRAIPNASVKIVEDSGHVPMEERPARTAALARQFLEDGR